MDKFVKGARVTITETEHGKLASPEVATVFEDYGTAYVSVRRTNGQLHAVPRTSVAKAAQ